MLQALLERMVAYYAGDPKRIQHFIKVHSFARHIGLEEKLDPQTQFILEAAALVHDIGIRPAEEKYGRCDGPLQEQEGPGPAREMLTALSFPPEVVERVCFLVGHHHTYQGVEGADWQILLEADFLVNLYEDQVPQTGVSAALERIFRTPTGCRLCRTMFSIPG